MDIKKEDLERLWNSLLNMEKELLDEAAKMEELPLFTKHQIREHLAKPRQKAKVKKTRVPVANCP